MAGRSAAAPPALRRLRFTLRLLLAALTLLCVWLAIHTQRARRQRAIVEQIEQGIGGAYYDFHYEAKDDGMGAKQQVSPVPKWLLDTLGVDFFHNVKAVHTRDTPVIADLPQLSALERLVIMEESLTDDEFVPVGRIDGLRCLWVLSDKHQETDRPDTTHLGDRSLQLIARMPALEEAYIDGRAFTAEGVQALGASSSLRKVHVSWCDESVDERGLAPLRESGRLKSLRVGRWSPEKGDAWIADW